MKILMVLPVLGHGGGQKYLSDLANYWVNLGHKVILVSLREGKSFYPLSSQVELISLGYVPISHPNKMDRGLSRVKTMIEYRRLLKKRKPDFVLSILSSTNILTLLVSRFLNTRVYVQDVMSPYRKRSSLERFLRRHIYKWANGIICLTNESKEIIQKETNCKRITVIPNPVDLSNMYPNIKRENIIINVGRLHPDKGQIDLLNIFSKLKGTGWKFVILGEGPEREKLNNKVVELNLEKEVYMPGAVTNVKEWLAKASIFAFTSKSEAWGIALTEAMASGLPIVTYDCPVGPREMIQNNENGFIVPVGEINLFTEKINSLMQDSELRARLSIQARKDAHKYSIDIIAEDVLDFCNT